MKKAVNYKWEYKVLNIEKLLKVGLALLSAKAGYKHERMFMRGDFAGCALHQFASGFLRDGVHRAQRGGL